MGRGPPGPPGSPGVHRRAGDPPPLARGAAPPVVAAHRQRDRGNSPSNGRDCRRQRAGGAGGQTASNPGIFLSTFSSEIRTQVLDARAMSRALQRMAVEILEVAHGTDDLLLVGIQRRGVELAERIATLIEKDEGVAVPRGALDITLYRDDLGTVGPKPVIGETHLPGDLTGKHVVIVDDVLYTGRRSEEHTSELQSLAYLVCRLLLEKKKQNKNSIN